MVTGQSAGLPGFVPRRQRLMEFHCRCSLLSVLCTEDLRVRSNTGTAASFGEIGIDMMVPDTCLTPFGGCEAIVSGWSVSLMRTNTGLRVLLASIHGGSAIRTG